MLAVYTSPFESLLQLMSVLLIFIFVLALTYVTTRWIAKYEKGRSFNKNLRIIETLKVSTNKFLQIIEVGDEYLVIAIGKDEVNLLTKLSKEQLKELPSEEIPEMISKESFKEVLDKVKKHLPKK